MGEVNTAYNVPTTFPDLLGAPPPDNYVMAPITPGTPAPLPAQQASRESQGVDPDLMARMEKYGKAQPGVLPTILGIYSAAKGNVGPLMKLQEQKRSTAFAKAVFPDIVEINNRTNRGDWEGALKLADALGQASGDRSPEVVGLFRDISNRISTKQQNWQNMKAVSRGYDAEVAAFKAKHGKDSPAAPLAKLLRETVNERTPIAESVLNTILTRGALSKQINEGQVVLTSGLAGTTETVPVPQVIQPGQVNTITGMLLAGENNMSTTDLQNILNETGTVNGIAVGSPEAQALKKQYTDLLRVQSEIEVGKTIPISPETSEQLQALDTAPLDILRRRFGSDKVNQALTLVEQRKGRIAEQTGAGAIKAEQEYSTLAGARAGQAYMNIDPDSKDALQVRYDVTPNEARRQGLKQVPIALADSVRARVGALQGLDYVDELSRTVKNPNTLVGRLGQGVRTKLSQWAGVPLNEDVLTKEAMRMVINHAIEQVNNQPGVNNQATGILKQYVTGAFASGADAVEIARIVQGRLKQEIMNAVGVAPQTTLPSTAPARAGQPGFTPSSPTTIYKPGSKPLTRKETQALGNAILQQGQPTQPPNVPGAPAVPPAPTAPSTAPAAPVMKKGTLR